MGKTMAPPRRGNRRGAQRLRGRGRPRRGGPMGRVTLTRLQRGVAYGLDFLGELVGDPEVQKAAVVSVLQYAVKRGFMRRKGDQYLLLENQTENSEDELPIPTTPVSPTPSSEVLSTSTTEALSSCTDLPSVSRQQRRRHPRRQPRNMKMRAHSRCHSGPLDTQELSSTSSATGSHDRKVTALEGGGTRGGNSGEGAGEGRMQGAEEGNKECTETDRGMADGSLDETNPLNGNVSLSPFSHRWAPPWAPRLRAVGAGSAVDVVGSGSRISVNNARARSKGGGGAAAEMGRQTSRTSSQTSSKGSRSGRKRSGTNPKEMKIA